MARSSVEQSSYVKQGHFIDFGFEPCANAFFDFYITPRYIDPPLIELQDIGFFLFLRKNVNPKNPTWKMPSIRQIQQRLGISWDKLNAMMKRLERAKLLTKESGLSQGETGVNIANNYLLSDPLPTLMDFLVTFAEQLKPEWQVYLSTVDSTPNYDNSYDPKIETYATKNETTYDSKIETYAPKIKAGDVPKIGGHKQTSYKQTEWDTYWDVVLEMLQKQMSQTTFDSWMKATRLVGLTDTTATVALLNPKAKDWIENRLGRQIRQLLSIESKKEIVTIYLVADN